LAQTTVAVIVYWQQGIDFGVSCIDRLWHSVLGYCGRTVRYFSELLLGHSSKNFYSFLTALYRFLEDSSQSAKKTIYQRITRLELPGR
jgi:hypothetical protein